MLLEELKTCHSIHYMKNLNGEDTATEWVPFENGIDFIKTEEPIPVLSQYQYRAEWRVRDEYGHVSSQYQHISIDEFNELFKYLLLKRATEHFHGNVFFYPRVYQITPDMILGNKEDVQRFFDRLNGEIWTYQYDFGLFKLPYYPYGSDRTAVGFKTKEEAEAYARLDYENQPFKRNWLIISNIENPWFTPWIASNFNLAWTQMHTTIIGETIDLRTYNPIKYKIVDSYLKPQIVYGKYTVSLANQLN